MFLYIFAVFGLIFLKPTLFPREIIHFIKSNNQFLFISQNDVIPEASPNPLLNPLYLLTCQSRKYAPHNTHKVHKAVIYLAV